MKIRKGFVTNSSSSSFIIAVKNDATLKNIYDELWEIIDLDDVKKWVEKEWVESENVQEILSDVANEIYDYHMSGMEFPGWHVNTREYSNEDSDVGAFFYDFLDIRGLETEHMKIEGGY